MIQGFGDSNVAGYGVSAGQSFMGLFIPVNSGVSGAQAAEVSSLVQQATPTMFALYPLHVGLNDVSKYLGDAAKKEYYRRCLRAGIAWLALFDKKTSRGAQAGITFTGAWSDIASPNPCGKYTTQSGATALATVSGDTIYIGVTEGDNSSNGENISVKVDGVEKGPFSTKVSGITTWLGQSWGRTCWRIDGLSSGSHDVLITNNSPSGKSFSLDWIAGSNQIAASRLRVMNIAKCSAAWYSAAGVTEAMIQGYNDIIASVAAEFYQYGVRLVDVFAYFDAATCLQADGAHWNALGHYIVHQVCSGAA